MTEAWRQFTVRIRMEQAGVGLGKQTKNETETGCNIVENSFIPCLQIYSR